jgi:uncharacterized membrane protein
MVCEYSVLRKDTEFKTMCTLYFLLMMDSTCAWVRLNFHQGLLAEPPSSAADTATYIIYLLLLYMYFVLSREKLMVCEYSVLRKDTEFKKRMVLCSWLVHTCGFPVMILITFSRGPRETPGHDKK